MTINAKTRRIRFLLTHTDMTKSEIARKVGVDRQRITQVQQEFDENPYVDFDGLKLKSRREAAGLSMTQLAKKVGTHTSQVSRWEGGKQTPWPNMWRKLCKVLGCFVQDFEKNGVQV